MNKSVLSFAAAALALSTSLAFAQGSISGKAVLQGAAPGEKPIKMDADPYCAKSHPTQATTRHYVTGAGGGLANVFVYVKDGLAGKKFPAPTQTKVLDQKDCLYVPYVMGVQVGQPLDIINSDGTLHNVHCVAKANGEFNLSQPSKGMKNTKSFSKPEIMVQFKCDVHPWMFAYVGVVDHPFFAVTKEDGTFSITGLPPGEYTLEAWHHKGGTLTQKVKVEAGEAKAPDFAFKAK
jgi:plastocyanin